MKRFEMEEAVSLLGGILDALLETLEGRVDRSMMEARNNIGKLRADATELLEAGAMAGPLLKCFDLCLAAGSSRVAMDGVRRAMVARSPKYVPGVIVATTGIFFSLLEQARILGDITFKSREEIDVMLSTMHAEFEPAEEFAATHTADPRVYEALVGLHAALSSDLSDRALPLPRLVRYHFPTRMPSVKLAMRIYGDARRADELVRVNRVVHPAFCLADGKCLSA